MKFKKFLFEDGFTGIKHSCYISEPELDETICEGSIAVVCKVKTGVGEIDFLEWVKYDDEYLLEKVDSNIEQNCSMEIAKIFGVQERHSPTLCLLEIVEFILNEEWENMDSENTMKWALPKDSAYFQITPISLA